MVLPHLNESQTVLLRSLFPIVIVIVIVVNVVVVRCSCGEWIAAHQRASLWSSFPCLQATVSSTRASTPPSSSLSSSRVTPNKRVRPSLICPWYLLRPLWCLVQPLVPQTLPYTRSIIIYGISLVNLAFNRSTIVPIPIRLRR